VSWQRFNGNPGDKDGFNFKIKDWEVWRYVFESDDKEKLEDRTKKRIKTD
jgi:hypothetical protein